MSHAPTPGQVAFAAYVAPGYALVPPAARPRWDDLTPGQQRCWDAAAQAVLDHTDTQRALACDVHEAAWTQMARCDCDLRVPVGSLCASCDSLKSIADAAGGTP